MSAFLRDLLGLVCSLGVSMGWAYAALALGHKFYLRQDAAKGKGWGI